MNSGIVTVTITIFMMVLNSSWAQFPMIKTKATGIFTSKHYVPKQPFLRSRVPLNDTPIIKMDGFLEAVKYETGDCQNAKSKTVVTFNLCTASADPDHTGEYNQATIYAYPEFNYYDIYSQYYNDSACQTFLSSYEYVLPILICDDSELDHVISQPLSPTGDNLGFSLLLYNTQDNCVSNNYEVGVIEAVYSHVNLCFPAAEPSDGDTDTMVASCNSTNVVVNVYSTKDGSCGGYPVQHVLSSSTSCSSGNMTLLNNYFGYFNFGCALNPSTEELPRESILV